jgi:hypothetical protein
MSEWQLTTPVALLIFKRPETTRKVFEAIRQAKPPKLLVVSNIPPAERPEQMQDCMAARAIIDEVDWDCEVLKNYAETYLSCKDRIYSGLDWVFSTVERAIVLEDDCVPHPTFWRFCEELLDYYQDEERVVAISGDNFQMGRRRTSDSYYFSRYTHFWGWASWRRAWQYYDVDMKRWGELRDTPWLNDFLGDAQAASWWYDHFQRTYAGQIDTWDWQWIFSAWLRDGLTVVPNVNLVSNIGFSKASTHTKVEDWRSNLPTKAMELPLQHPTSIVPSDRADRFEQKEYYHFITHQNTWENRIKRRFRGCLKSWGGSKKALSV